MLRRPTAWLALMLLLGGDLLFALPPEPAGDTNSTQNPMPPDRKPPPAPAVAPKKLDLLRLPSDAVLIVTEQANDILKMVPKYIVLAPDKYQEYLDTIGRLEAQLETLRKVPAAPSSCRLKGRLDGNQVVLQAQFGFVTDKPGTVINLACAPAFAGVGAQLDGKEPNLNAQNGGGFAVQVEQPGHHTLTLDLTLPVANKPDGRGFEMDLPRAAITDIDLELPSSKDVRRDGKPLSDPRLVFRDGRLKGGLGAVDKLDLSWKDTGATTNVPAVLSAVGKVQVQIDDREALTRADLTLKVEGGQTNAWTLLVPLGAVVEVAKEDEGRVQQIDVRDSRYHSRRVIWLKETGGEPLNVTVTVKAPSPRPGVVVPVGPFDVRGAQRQSGVITVSGAPGGQRLLFTRRGSTEEARLPDDERRPGAVSFRYPGVVVPANPQPQAATGPASLSWLDIDAEAIHGLIEARVTHLLRLQRDETRGRFWHVKTTIEGRPVRPGADHLDLLLPPGCVYDDRVFPAPAALVQKVETDVPLAAPGFAVGPVGAAGLQQLGPDALPRVLRLKFAEQLTAFPLTIEADYPAPVNGAGEATLPLPRPLGTPDRGGQVTVAAAEDAELLPPLNDNAALKLEQHDPQQQVWRSELFPEQVRVHWRLRQPRVRASAVVDLTFTPREVHVRHRLRFQFAGTVPGAVALVVPDAIAAQFHVVTDGDGDAAVADSGRPHVRVVPLRAPAAKGEAAVAELDYSFPLPAGQSGEPFTVPLAVPDQVVEGDTKVRVWADPGATPALPPGLAGWSEQGIEVVKDNPRLPSLVLLARTPDTELSLRLDEANSSAGGGSAATVVIDRALIRVSVGDAGQSYRASFLLTRLLARDLAVEFPAPVISLEPRAVIDFKDGGRKEVPFEPVDGTGRRDDGSRLGRMRLDPDLLRGPAVLEVSYHLPAGRSPTGPLQTTLQPPLVRGNTGRVQTRWLVALPSDLTVLGPEGGPGSEPTWGWQGWLPAPRVAVTSADVERWFAGGTEATRSDDSRAFVPSLVATRSELGPLTVLHAPQQVWLLVCSLVLLACGLGLFLLVRPSAHGGATTTRVGAMVTVLLVSIVAAVVGRFLLPTLTYAIFFGCLPGLIVLAFAFAAHVLLQEHHRRQIVFLPSFTRGRAGSSIVRAGSAGSNPRPHATPQQRGEPSTVDLAPPTGSLPRPLGDVLRTEEAGGSKRTG